MSNKYTSDTRKQTNLIAFAWILVIPVLVTMILLGRLAPHLVHQPDLSALKDLMITKYIPSCFPKPKENLRYIWAISSVPFLYFFLFPLIRKPASRIKDKYGLILLTLGIQITLLSFCNHVWNAGSNYYVLQKHMNQGVQWAVLSVVILGGYLALLKKYPRKFEWKWSNHFIYYFFDLAALFFIFIELLPSVLTEENFGVVNGDVAANFAHTAGEVWGVLAGKTPLVDFIPQYQNFISILLLPYLKFFGVSVFTITLGFGLLSATGLFCIYWVLRRLTSSPLLAFLLFMPILSMGCHPMVILGPAKLFYTFNYYALWPFRFFFPLLVLLLLSGVLMRTTKQGLVILFTIATLGMINSMDFGLPALVAAIVAVFLSQGHEAIKKKKVILSLAKTLLLSMVLAMAIICSFTLARTGKFPILLFEILSFQKIFAIYGFNLVPTPPWGIQLLCYATYMACLLVAVYRVFTIQKPNSMDRLTTGLLLFIGVFGPGTLMYYMGRSYPSVLTGVIIPWALALMILLRVCFVAIFSVRWTTKNAYQLILYAIPTGILMFHFAIFLTDIYYYRPQAVLELERFRIESPKYPKRTRDIANFVKKHLNGNEPVTLYFDWGDATAIQLGLKNVMPFPNPHAMFLLSQIKLLEDQMAKEGVKKFFATNWFRNKEIDEMITRNSFVLKETKDIEPFGVIEFYER